MSNSSERQRRNKRYRDWKRSLFAKALEDFGAALAGDPVYGWNDRSVSGQVTTSGDAAWLRVVSEDSFWTDEDFWTGNVEAAQIPGVDKPRLLRWQEWTDGSHTCRAELMTLAPGRQCSATEELRAPIRLADTWWAGLRSSLDALAAYPTDRQWVDQDRFSHRLRMFFGDKIDPAITRWVTVHGDLHWSNLRCPDPCILDWEGWGRGPAGLDAATLYCRSLLVPEVADRIGKEFAGVLETPDGIRAQLYVIAHMLLRSGDNEFQDLIIPLHRLADTLIRR